MSSNPLSLPNMQALILLSTWIFPATRFWTDSSRLLINIAVSAGIQFGMHRPGWDVEYAKTEITLRQIDILERSRTWAACLIMSHVLAVDFGYVSGDFLQHWTIKQSCQTDAGVDLPTELRHNLIIQRLSNEALSKLSRNGEDPLGSPPAAEKYRLIEGFEKEFDSLSQHLAKDISFTNNIRLAAAKLYLQTLYFLDSPLVELRKEGIMRSYSTACSLIASLISGKKSHDILSYAPANVFRIVFCAAIVLWKVLNSAYGKELDRTTGKVLFDAATFVSRQIAVVGHETDLPRRAADGLSTLWDCAEKDPKIRLQEPRIRVHSRMAASIVYDCIKMLRDFKCLYGCGPLNGGAEGAISTNVLGYDDGQLPAPSAGPTVQFAPAESTGMVREPVAGQDVWADIPYVDWIWDYGYSAWDEF